MFEGTLDKDPSTPNTKPHHRRFVTFSLGVAVLLLAIVAILLGYKILSARGYVISEQIIGKVSHAIFVPQKLPSGYKVSSGSFSFSEGNLVFSAADKSGSSITFSEQRVPKDFDFEKFYQAQIENAKRLDDTPYPSVIGKVPDSDKTLLSVVADDTWIIASTSAPLGEQEFATIAKGMKQY